MNTFNAVNTALLTDKYELTMLQAALDSGVAHKQATFELFARRLPSGRRYGVVAGVHRAIEAVENFTFTEAQLTYLATDPVFKPSTLEYLKHYKFSGTIIGYNEGELYFPYSPILTVEGTFGDAVLLETVLLSILNHDSAVASAASRMVVAARGRFPLIEMGSRRTHEFSAVDAARAAYLTGFAASSNLEAGMRYDVPTTGTSAHAFTLAHSKETEAFQAQVNALGVTTTLLVDTYNTSQGIRNAIAVAGPALGAIRIDSGDLYEETVKARALLDSLGAKNTKIILSSDIDEYVIDDLVVRKTPVDGVGAGTRVVTGSGHPTAGMVFKLVEREAENGRMLSVAKKSEGKNSVGGLKRIYRTFENGFITGEHYSVEPGDFNPDDAADIQRTYIFKGTTLPQKTLKEARSFHEARLAQLPPAARLTAHGEAAFSVDANTVGN